MRDSFKDIKYLLFDAANTLIHKPAFWERLLSVLQQHKIFVSLEKLQYNHKLLTETIIFPDRTSETFYQSFNKELLLSLGIIPSDILLEDIFLNCSYLPWEKFNDTNWIAQSTVRAGVLSNFSNNLQQLLLGLFGDVFSDIIVSETLSMRKPSMEFYGYAIESIGLSPNEILYVGDSLKLDIIPAMQCGMHVLLIDRHNIYKGFKFSIGSLWEILQLLNNN
jgi:putative hydrolase of the HAD superfamily